MKILPRNTILAFILLSLVFVATFLPETVEGGKKKKMMKKLKKLAMMALMAKAQKKILIPLPLPLPVPVP